ncbi:hypothetical protein NPIL_476281 [Nephila pilipes]|uniref:Uncharacterized protein n=1 Tax=Nephila pilipes TaxID=299642 RepID=A0A8X6Q374_NEPPI|nr:hypothetical protein NPIL_476281 [Nephila pilipes]
MASPDKRLVLSDGARDPHIVKPSYRQQYGASDLHSLPMASRKHGSALLSGTLFHSCCRIGTITRSRPKLYTTTVIA